LEGLESRHSVSPAHLAAARGSNGHLPADSPADEPVASIVQPGNGAGRRKGGLDPKKIGQTRIAPATALADVDTLDMLGATPAFQLSLFAPDHPIVEELKGLDVLSLTPLQALNLLASLADRARD
jgi:hypothetical protein